MASRIIADTISTLDAMPSSVRSGTPRLVNLRTSSIPTIRVDREVKVVIRPADGPKKRAVYSTMPSISKAHARAPIIQGPNIATSSAPLLNRRHSTSKVLDTSSRQNLGRTQSSRGLATLENNRESMNALSEFLMRSEPPLSSFTSRPESDAGSLHSIRKSAFKFFGRQKMKKEAQSPKLMRLPDSAVSAKTTGGARHIAISIPLEYDHPYNDTATQSVATPQPLFQSHLSSDWPPERGTVTVLKPVAEGRESTSSFLPSGSDEIREESRASQAESATTRGAEVQALEPIQNLEGYTKLDPQERSQQKSSKAEGKMVVKQDSTPTQSSFIAVPPVDIIRHDSTRTDPRHSGGTEYSTASIGTIPSHSRGQSSASSAPSPLVSDFPARKPNAAKASRGMETGSAHSYNANKTLAATDDPARSSILSEKSANESITPSLSASNSPTIFGTAKTAQGYNAASTLQTISRGNTPKSLDPTSPATNREQSDVPESPCIPAFFPSLSPPISRRPSPDIGVIDDTISNHKKVASVNINTEESTRKRRQDRVKARKQRDVALHRDKSSDKSRNRSLQAENATTGNPQIRTTPPLRSPNRTSVPSEKASRQASNTVTDILVVADLPPSTGVVSVEDLPKTSSTPLAVNKANNESNSPKGSHTPPVSFSSSMESDTDTITQDRSLGQPRGGVKSSSLDARRQERRLKRNMNLREKEVDARLEKIERENAIILHTLSGIAGSFGDLSRILPRSAVGARKQSGLLTDARGLVQEEKKAEDSFHGQVKRIEPVIGELQDGRGRSVRTD